jgi:hypothetical protein
LQSHAAIDIGDSKIWIDLDSLIEIGKRSIAATLLTPGAAIF